MNKARLISGKVKKSTGLDLDPNRYTFLDLSNAEPDLGLPEVDGYGVISNRDGTRSWGSVGGDTGAFSFTGSTMTTSDSSDIRIVQNVVAESDLTVENTLRANDFVITGDTILANLSVTGNTTLSGTATIPYLKTESISSTESSMITFDTGLLVYGNLEISGTIDSDDSSAITIIPSVITNSDLTVENDLIVNNDVTIQGNLTVNGSRTTVDTVNLTVTDKLVEIAKDSPNAAATSGAGIILDGPAIRPSLLYSSVDDAWNFNKTLNVPMLSTGDSSALLIDVGLTVQSDINVENDLIVRNSIRVTEDVTVGGNVTVSGTTDTAKLLTNDIASSDSSDIQVKNNLVVQGDITGQNNIYTTGYVNATTYFGDGSNLTGVVSSGTASLTISDNAPAAPVNGELWLDSTLMTLFVYYVDTDSSQWVQPKPTLPPSHGAGATSWTVVTSATYTAATGQGYLVDTASNAVEISLPASAVEGQEFKLVDAGGNAATNNITVNRNGHAIAGDNTNSANITISTARAALALVYYNTTQGWVYTEDVT